MTSSAKSGSPPSRPLTAAAIPWSLARTLGQTDRRALLLLGDVLASVAAVVLGLWLWTFTSGATFGWAYLWARAEWLGLVPAWLLLNLDLYAAYHLPSGLGMIRRLAATAGIALAVELVAYFLAGPQILPRLMPFYFVVFAFLLGGAWRWLFVLLMASAAFQRTTVVVGAGWAGQVISRTLAQRRSGEYRVTGFIDDDPAKQGQFVAGLPVLGGTAALLPAVRAQGATVVILAVMGELPGATFQALLECQAAGIPVLRMSSLYEQLTGRVPIEHLDADLMVATFIEQAERGRLFLTLERLLDLLAAIVGLAGLGLLLPFVAAAIVLESRGPVFYGQTRMGRGGRLFTLWKFRTMVAEAEADGAARWAEANDERVTRVGRWLRRYRVDEAPQFLNILLGHLSLIGPRPERPEFVTALEQEIPFYRARHLVKPGLTGWAQVNYGYSATVADAAVKLQWDLYYIKHRSPWLYLVILLRTVGVVLSGRGT